MLSLFRALVERLKALFVTDIALEFEAELLTRAAERKAELLRQATRYEEEGLRGIADHLRRQAEALDLHQPLASVQPAAAHLLAEPDEPAPPQLQVYPRPPSPASASRPLSSDLQKKKGK